MEEHNTQAGISNDAKLVKQVEYIIDNVPLADTNSALLTALVWSRFEGIDIPPKVIAQIAAHATSPDSITRTKRFIKEARIVSQSAML